MKIPIKSVKEFANKYNYTHVVIFAYDGKQQHIATYGKNIEQCSQAADAGNNLKKFLGWPENLYKQPSRVKKLQNRIKELEEQIQTHIDVRTN